MTPPPILRSKNHRSTIEIPLEVVFHILVMLPVKTLLRFKSVCKDWYNIINDSNFIKLHLKQSLKIDSGHDRSLACAEYEFLYLVDDLDYPSQHTILNCPYEVVSGETMPYFDVIGSCHGLLCLRFLRLSNLDGFIICNPSTRSFKRISLPVDHLVEMELDTECCSCGFGYDSKKDDYKIVLTLKKVLEIAVFCYSLKADTWVVSQSLPLYRYIDHLQNHIIYGNNMLHYIFLVRNKEGVTTDSSKDPNHGLNRIIARFNLCSEEWEDEFSLPTKIPYDFIKDRVYLGFIDGCLRLCHNQSESKDIWVMTEYGVERSWTQLFSISHKDNYYSCYDLISIANSTRGPEVLLSIFPVGLFWYDQKNKTFKNFKYQLWYIRRVHTYVGSLVSIPGCSQMRLKTSDLRLNTNNLNEDGETIDK